MMTFFNYIVIVVLTMVSICYSRENHIDRRLKRDADTNWQRLFDILKAQDEKINGLHTSLVTNQYLPKCVESLKSGNVLITSKCWKEMISEIKIYDPSTTTEINLLSRLIVDAYEGENKSKRLLQIVAFIRDNVEMGSETAFSAYKSLIKAMEFYGHFYLKNIVFDNGLGSGLIDFTYRTLIEIQKADGNESSIFIETLPSAVKTILWGKQIFIRNAATKDYLAAPREYEEEAVVSVARGDENDPRFFWKLIPVQPRWDKYDQELFYIENKVDKKILSVDDGRLKVEEADEERLKSTWSMFYIRLVEGRGGDAVAIQCSYWGIKTLGLAQTEEVPKLVSSNSLDEVEGGIWLLQPKFE